MKNLLNAAALAVCMVAGAAGAHAATTTTPETKTPAYAAPVIDDANAMKAADMQHVSLRQQLTNQLEKAGYTQVKVTPSSFFVEAKDKKGDPVAMVIGPDSFAEVTDIPMKTSGAAALQTPSANVQQK